MTDQNETITGNWDRGEYSGEMFTEWKNGDWKRSRYKNEKETKVACRFGDTQWEYIDGRADQKLQKARITCPDFRYEGEVDQQGLRQGRGITYFSNGDRYEGRINEQHEMHDDDCTYLIDGFVYRGSIYHNGQYGEGFYKNRKALWNAEELKWTE